MPARAGEDVIREPVAALDDTPARRRGDADFALSRIEVIAAFTITSR